jgi:hypothetical protein
MSELQKVEFVKSNSPYGVGDKASFKPDIAEKLRAKGVAVFLKTEKANDDDKQADDDGRRPGARATAKADAGARAKKDKPAKGRVRVR